MGRMRCGYRDVCGRRIAIVEHHILMVLIKEDGLDYHSLIKKIYSLQERLNPQSWWKYNYKTPTIRKGLILLICKGLIDVKKTYYWKNYYLNYNEIEKYFDLDKPVSGTIYL